MIARHAKLLRISGNAFKSLRTQIETVKYSPKKRAGFLIEESSPSRLAGRFMHVKTQRIKNIDPETLKEEVVEQPILLTCTFAINIANNTILCQERRSDLNLLEDVFNGLEGVNCEFVDFATDVTEIYRRLRDSYGKVDLRTLRIKDYLGREGLMTTASFKLMEPSKEDEIIRKYSDTILGFSASIMTDVGRKSLSVAKNGSVRASEDVPEDIVEAVLGYLPQFHEEVQVETVEI